MAKQLSPEERQRIVDELKAGMSVREAARTFGSTPSTVSRLARTAGIEPAARAATKSATEANLADARAQLAEMAPLLIAAAHRLAGQLFAPQKAFAFGGKDNIYTEHEIPEPTARDKQALMTSIGIAVQRAAEITRQEAPGVSEAKGLVRELLDGIQEWAEE